MKLYIGNKNYSSWSLRPWLLLKHFDIPFTEVLVSVSGKGAHDGHRAYAPNGLVPCLHDGDFMVWDTLAIAEYVAELYPDKQMWPASRQDRARARCISAEMHSGFGNLRSACGMNIKMKLQGAQLDPQAQADVQRIDQIWSECRKNQATNPSDQGYLFGDFSIADAMFAPVVWRFHSYNIGLSDSATAYLSTMLSHEGMKQWQEAALQEQTALAHYDEAALQNFGPVRT